MESSSSTPCVGSARADHEESTRWQDLALSRVPLCLPGAPRTIVLPVHDRLASPSPPPLPSTSSHSGRTPEPEPGEAPTPGPARAPPATPYQRWHDAKPCARAVRPDPGRTPSRRRPVPSRHGLANHLALAHRQSHVRGWPGPSKSAPNSTPQAGVSPRGNDPCYRRTFGESTRALARTLMCM